MGFNSSVTSQILRLACSTRLRKRLNVSIFRITEAIYAIEWSLEALNPWLPSFPWSSICSLTGKECVELPICFGRKRMERTRTRSGRHIGSYITSAPNLHKMDSFQEHFIFVSRKLFSICYVKESYFT